MTRILQGKNYLFIAFCVICSTSIVRSLQVAARQSKVVVTEGETAKIRWSVNTNEELIAVRCSVNKKGLTNGDFGKLDLPYSCTGIYFHYDIFFIVQLFDYLPFRLRILKLEMKILQIKGDDTIVCYSNCIFQSNSFRISQTLIPFLQSSPAL